MSKYTIKVEGFLNDRQQPVTNVSISGPKAYKITSDALIYEWVLIKQEEGGHVGHYEPREITDLDLDLVVQLQMELNWHRMVIYDIAKCLQK